MRAGQQVAVPATDRPALPGWAVWAGPLLVVLVGPLALFPQFFPRPGVILALLLLLLPFGLRWAATRRLSVPTPLTPFAAAAAGLAPGVVGDAALLGSGVAQTNWLAVGGSGLF